ncbi:MAG: DNA-binding protein [Lachnospiraceae bacterium]|nr:DNA-binding protein [Lachnospiraceae bacterium]
MEEKVYRGRLYDFYGELLSDHKREIYEAYVIDDLSMTEIADLVGLTKQGVSDQIKRCTAKMNEMEEKLHLCERFDRIGEKLDAIIGIAEANGYADIKRLAEDISEEV